VCDVTLQVTGHERTSTLGKIDEYQDCVVEHHDLVVALADAIPQCAILGDPLQGIFDFGDSELVDWPSHVHPRFPVYARDQAPWRWTGHNGELGQWLLEIRPLMVAGGTLDLSKVKVQGLEWKQAGPQGEIQAAFNVSNRGGSVVMLHAQRNQHKIVGKTTKGMYSIMEISTVASCIRSCSGWGSWSRAATRCGLRS
jgi:hypothetical protein